jgi:hypothetical protein
VFCLREKNKEERKIRILMNEFGLKDIIDDHLGFSVAKLTNSDLNSSYLCKLEFFFIYKFFTSLISFYFSINFILSLLICRNGRNVENLR